MTQTAEPTIDRLIDEVLQRYAPQPSSLIAILQDLQESLHFLPEAALNRIARELQVPRSQVYHVATFYKAFSMKPKGKHIINICRGTACHVQGAEKIHEMLHSELKVGDGETTDDGLFTVQSVRCLGCCSLAPAIMIDKEVFGGVTPSALRTILKRFRSE